MNEPVSLENIHQSVGGHVQLVLHGTTTDSEVEGSIRHGITKVNLNRQLPIWHGRMLAKKTFVPQTALMDEEIEVSRREIERLCDLCRSSGKAPKRLQNGI
jgi:fructose/tagatose bisphosphate aldolase